MSRPLVITGPSSGVGKTTVAAGIMGAFSRRGIAVAPFKAGPDYIDTGYHQQATGVPSRNLDTWLTTPGVMSDIYDRAAARADVSVVEGVMGLYDGLAGGGEAGSTAEIARLLGGAVVLVVDCSRQAGSLAPLLWGFRNFDKRLPLAGAILNNVGSPRHARMLRDAAGEAGVQVWGEIPRTPDISLKSRHLGLVPAAEHVHSTEILKRTIDLVAGCVDLEALLEAAGGPMTDGAPGDDSGIVAGAAVNRVRDKAPEMSVERGSGGRGVRIAVARDEAFSFYYVDSLEALAAAGADLVDFSPLRDESLPDCDGLYLGGGFPEMFAEGLEDNVSMRRSVAQAVADGLPTYAECGGMVYLCRAVSVDGRRRQMVGAIGSEAVMAGRRRALGYVEARARGANVLMPAGERVRGHQFHWSQVEWQQEHLAYNCFSGHRPEMEPDGFNRGNLLATYVHIHFAGNPQAAQRFVAACGGKGEVGASAATAG